MLERFGFGARVETKFWNAVGSIIVPDSVFSGFRLDKVRLSPSKKMLEALIPKQPKKNEDFSLPTIFDLRKKPARFDLGQTSSLTMEKLQEKREREGFCHVACAFIHISNEAILKSPEMLSRCAFCKGEGAQTQNFSMPTTTIA